MTLSRLLMGLAGLFIGVSAWLASDGFMLYGIFVGIVAVLFARLSGEIDQ